MSQYIEETSILDDKTKNITRAINSLKEELEAIDWYNQRVNITSDNSLKAIMAHNRDEEIEHACMTIEWLRRNMDVWNEELRTYLFTEGDITGLEDGEERSSNSNDQGLNIGNMK